MVTESIYDEEAQSKTEAEGSWCWLRKELQIVWSAMSDAGFGTFGPANTMLLDESARSSSHPENVIEVPDWERDETGQILADVGAFVDSLLLATPVDIPKYLDMHQAFPSNSIITEPCMPSA